MPDRIAERVTVIIPTVHHRAHLFARALRHLSQSGFTCPILVTDHSPAPERAAVAEAVRSVPGLDVTVVHHAPELHFLERLTDCAARARTPYVHLHADDDFLVRAALERLVATLDDAPDAAAAMGLNLHVTFVSRDVSLAPKLAIAARTPFERLVAQLESYSSVLYALRRRDEFVASLSYAVARCPDVQFWQYLESCMAALAGRIATIDELHYVREVHTGKWSATLVRERSCDHFPYLLLSPEFGPRVAAFRAALLDACAERNIARDQSAIDAGLIHLLYRGIGTMGLPPKTVGAADETQDTAARLEALLADRSQPAAMELTRIFALATGADAPR
ncbi:MAG: TIGR00180 family glycosyltransferase [Gemmatimonas sp.]